MAEFTLRIDGMHCGSCVRRVSQALAATPGVVVKYRAGGTTYTSTLMVGLVIGSAAKSLSSACDAATRSVRDSWEAH